MSGVPTTSDAAGSQQKTPVKRTATRLKTEKVAPAARAASTAATTTASTTTLVAATAPVQVIPDVGPTESTAVSAAPSLNASSNASPTKVKAKKLKKPRAATREGSAASSSLSRTGAAQRTASQSREQPAEESRESQPQQQQEEEPHQQQERSEEVVEAPNVEATKAGAEEEPRRSLPPDDSDSSDGLDSSTSASNASGGSPHRGTSLPGSVRRAPELVTSLAGKRHAKVVMNPPSAALAGGAASNVFASLAGGGAAAGGANGRLMSGLHGASGRRGGGSAGAAAGSGASPAGSGGHHHGDSTLRYRTDLDKQVIHFMFERFHQEQICPSMSAPAVTSSSADNVGGAAAAAAEDGKSDSPPPPPSAAAGGAAPTPASRARRTAVEEIFVPPNGDGEDKHIGLGDWHFFWMHVGRVRHTICSSDFRWQDQQIINHFPDHAELTRKDLMYKNIKRYLRENQANNYARLTLQTATDWVSAAAHAAPAGTEPGRENGSISPTAAGAGSGHTPLCTTSFCFADSVPITYNIPNDMSMFKEECQKQRGTQWIVKPTSRSQGKGIFIIDDVRALQRWVKEKKDSENIASFLATGPAKRSTWVAPSVLQQQRAAQQSLAEAAAAAGSGTSPPPGSPTSPTPANNGPVASLTSPTLPNTSSGGSGGGLGAYIVSRYISNPLLIGGKKFDLRLYVLVTSYKPLVAYLHEDGFARFCATRYNAGSLAQADLGSHLTNVALQKGDEHYNTSHGGKWSFQNLFLYVQGRYGPYAAEGMMKNIQFLVFHSLKAVEAVMFNDKHSFELYGYDILIDDNIKPHLIEVNASLSMSTTTVSDRLLKEQVLTDAMKIIFPPGFPANNKAMPYWEYRQRTDLTTQQSTGFKLLQF